MKNLIYENVLRGQKTNVNKIQLLFPSLDINFYKQFPIDCQLNRIQLVEIMKQNYNPTIEGLNLLKNRQSASIIRRYKLINYSEKLAAIHEKNLIAEKKRMESYETERSKQLSYYQSMVSKITENNGIYSFSQPLVFEEALCVYNSLYTTSNVKKPKVSWNALHLRNFTDRISISRMPIGNNLVYEFSLKSK